MKNWIANLRNWQTPTSESNIISKKKIFFSLFCKQQLFILKGEGHPGDINGQESHYVILDLCIKKFQFTLA